MLEHCKKVAKDKQDSTRRMPRRWVGFDDDIRGTVGLGTAPARPGSSTASGEP